MRKWITGEEGGSTPWLQSISDTTAGLEYIKCTTPLFSCSFHEMPSISTTMSDWQRNITLLLSDKTGFLPFFAHSHVSDIMVSLVWLQIRARIAGEKWKERSNGRRRTHTSFNFSLFSLDCCSSLASESSIPSAIASSIASSIAFTTVLATFYWEKGASLTLDLLLSFCEGKERRQEECNCTLKTWRGAPRTLFEAFLFDFYSRGIVLYWLR